MNDLIFPHVELATSSEHGKTVVFDILRKKNIVLTPEEWVRQHLVHYLIHMRAYPKSLIALEDGLRYAGMKKRSDVVVYDRAGDVFMLVECKSPRVKIRQKSMEQLSLYNQQYKAKYIVLTNGLSLLVYQMDYATRQFNLQQDIPDYK
jgi:hypothetical protein